MKVVTFFNNRLLSEPFQYPLFLLCLCLIQRRYPFINCCSCGYARYLSAPAIPLWTRGNICFVSCLLGPKEWLQFFLECHWLLPFPLPLPFLWRPKGAFVYSSLSPINSPAPRCFALLRHGFMVLIKASPFSSDYLSSNFHKYLTFTIHF